MTELPISHSGVGGFFSPGRRGGGCWWALPGFGLIGGGIFPFICIVRKSVLFQTAQSVNKKLEKISIKRLTINKTLDIIQSSIKHLMTGATHRQPDRAEKENEI